MQSVTTLGGWLGGRKLGSSIAITCVLAFIAFAAWSGSAQAHWAGFTGDIYQQRYINGGEREAITQNADCCTFLYHSYSFVSAKAVAGGNEQIGAEIKDNVLGYTGNKGAGFVRYCYYKYYEGPSELDCHDRDGNAWVAAGHNYAFYGINIQIHGAF